MGGSFSYADVKSLNYKNKKMSDEAEKTSDGCEKMSDYYKDNTFFYSKLWFKMNNIVICVFIRRQYEKRL